MAHYRDQALFELAAAIRARGYAFTAVTPATHDIVYRRAGHEWARDLRDVFGWNRPFRAPVLPAGMLALMQQADAVTPCGDGWRSLVRLASLEQSLFLHSGYPTESADAVFFGPDTYRFVSAVTSWLEATGAQPRRVVDIGCGSGPGAICVAQLRPGAEVIGVDINPQALDMANANAMLCGVRNLTLLASDLLGAVDGLFDLIIANPPYLADPAERLYRHGGGPLGAGLSLAIVDAAIERLAPGGTLLLYTGVAMPAPNTGAPEPSPVASPPSDRLDPFRIAVESRLARSGMRWSYRELDPDIFGEELCTAAYAGVERIAAVLLAATRPASAPPPAAARE